ncbi:unnamed protein product [Boreogadus saida]
MLQDEDFVFFLCFFHNIMPHVDMLYQKLQKKDIDAVFIKRALESFTSSVQTIRDSDQLQEPSGTDRQRTALTEEAKQRLSEEVCDTILAQTKARIKTFLRNSMGQERLNALAMLSMERELVLNMRDFYEKVIDRFAALKERRAKFQYK